FGIIERDACKQPVLLQQIVADPQGREQVLLVQGSKLLRPLEEKVELRGQRAVARIAVEALQERILGGLLENGLRFEARAQTTRESRLADSDRTLDHDEMVRYVSCFHALCTSARLNPADVTRPLSSVTRPSPGISRSGAISARGYRTKLRSTIPGCGRVSSGSVRRSRPYTSTSRSITLGPQRSRCSRAGRPCVVSIARRLASNVGGSSCVSTPTTALTNSGCLTGPKGCET